MEPKCTIPGHYVLNCMQCDFSTGVDAKDSDEAYDKAFRLHDEWHTKDGGMNCGGDHFVLICPDGTKIEC